MSNHLIKTSSRKTMRREHYLELKYISLRLRRIADQVSVICSAPPSGVFEDSYHRVLLNLLQEETEEKFKAFRRLLTAVLEESGASEDEVEHLTELDHEIRTANLFIEVKLELMNQGKRAKTAPDVRCLYCESKVHYISSCLGFENMAVQRRRRFLSENKLCFKCLKSHVGACVAGLLCNVCGKDSHHTIVHPL